MRFTSKHMLRLVTPAGLCLVLAACSAPGLNQEGTQVVGHAPSHLSPGQEPGYIDWNDRSDKISLHGGDAVAFNKAVQTENPWPRHQNRTHIHMDGDVAGRAVQRYKDGEVKAPVAESVE